MTKCSLILSILLVTASIVTAQGIAVNTDKTPADNSALLDIKSTTKGLLIPRMDFGARNLIAAPAQGLLIYQTNNTPGFYYYTGSAWSPVPDQMGNHIMTQNITANSNYISKTGSNQGIQILDNGAVSIRTKNIVNAITTDAEAFRFDTIGNILAVGRVLDAGSSSLATKIPVQGAGTRFMWYAPRGSLRFGRAIGTEWDDVNMNDFTFAGGNQVTADAYGAFAFGDQVKVTATVGVAFGSGVTVGGTAGFSAGASNTVYGFAGTAIGYTCRANGQGSVALGYRCSATGDYSVAIGYRATNNTHTGTMAMGDESTTDSVRNTLDNQFVARYAGGYRFYTSPTVGGAAPTGVVLSANANSWSSISDSTKKERFAGVDKEYFLTSLSKLKLGSWNYKGNAENRHYGPMAQEIFASFGMDKFGRIGCDTLLASADMDGIMMIMLQGLEKRSALQLEENKSLKTQLTSIAGELKVVQAENVVLKNQAARIDQLQVQLIAMQQQLNESKQTATANNQLTAIQNAGRHPHKIPETAKNK
ncbi:MAG: hypothetical protein JWP81_3189 [Ferruginibacter sp.]|nr:hypothetical protein [Ferruginibacter sp.]